MGRIQTQAEESNIRYVRGIGPKRAEALAKLGIHSIRDLFYLFPRRYEDRRNLLPIAQACPGQTVSIQGEILSIKLKPIRRMPLLEVLIGDASGMITAIWFNQAYLKKIFQEGQKIILFGKIEFYQNRFQITSPEYELMDEDTESIQTGRITPVYPLTEGLFQRSLRSILKHLLDTEIPRHIREYLPELFRSEHQLIHLSDAIKEMHFPSSFESLEAARRRIVFDEFFIFQLILLSRLEKTKTKHRAFALKSSLDLMDSFAHSLPFLLTQGQQMALRDLAQDMSSEIPMTRLLQGDVGSGKTVVAAFALCLAAKNGFQGALLVPTEILAEQHYRTISKMLEPLAIPTALLTSSTPAPRRERILAEIKQNKISVLIGTHAILQEDILFQALALLIVDEQHKFGVHQRSKLLAKDPRPHQLVMTATPIPRTLALTVYGDLEVSLIRELPKGRQPVKTYWITRKKQDAVLRHIREKIGQGDQAYIVFPVIDETEKSDLLAAATEYEKLRNGAFKNIPMGLIHGRLSTEERNLIMSGFQSNDIKVLVATSVIEVGVDNPNATMMVIENAERFGLSQLHQLRGRIGRGEKPSECFLFGEPKTEDGAKRLRVLTKSHDGFEIAEEDLKLRGHGDFLGTRQSGEPVFRIANPVLDQPILLEARRAAQNLIKSKTILNATSPWASLLTHLKELFLRY